MDDHKPPGHEKGDEEGRNGAGEVIETHLPTGTGRVRVTKTQPGPKPGPA
jgi:hypothetical protein